MWAKAPTPHLLGQQLNRGCILPIGCWLQIMRVLRTLQGHTRPATRYICAIPFALQLLHTLLLPGSAYNCLPSRSACNCLPSRSSSNCLSPRSACHCLPSRSACDCLPSRSACDCPHQRAHAIASHPGGHAIATHQGAHVTAPHAVSWPLSRIHEIASRTPPWPRPPCTMLHLQQLSGTHTSTVHACQSRALLLDSQPTAFVAAWASVQTPMHGLLRQRR